MIEDWSCYGRLNFTLVIFSKKLSGSNYTHISLCFLSSQHQFVITAFCYLHVQILLSLLYCCYLIINKYRHGLWDILPPWTPKASFKFSLFLFWNACFACVKGDVYPTEPSDGFTVNQVLDAHWGVLYDEDVSQSSIYYCFSCLPINAV